MILKGQCKEDFEKWLRCNPHSLDLTVPTEDEYSVADIMHPLYFNRLPFSMRYGVYVDFFDSKAIFIQNGIIIANNKFYYYGGNTRNEARQKAIEKAVEIYNSR